MTGRIPNGLEEERAAELAGETFPSVDLEGPAGSGVFKVLLPLRCLALAILALFVCVGLSKPAGRSVGLVATAIAAVAADRADDGEMTRLPAQAWRDTSSHAIVDLTAAEADHEEDTRSDVCEPAAPLTQCVLAPPHRPHRLLRGELPADTSRFAAGTGLPRGPPTGSRAG